ncbi:MAG: alkaline phosphatase family protein [Bacteroidia bacterium]|nr:alkaline phosphatase family protein [Bacteroidia bacterium]
MNSILPRYLHIAILALLTAWILPNTNAQNLRTVQTADITSPHPKLVLWLVVDNLSQEQLHIVMPRLGENGIKRIFNGGTQLAHAYYDAGGNYAGKNMATLFTGAPACTHGIVGEQWIDHFSNHRIHAIFGDAYDSNTGKLDSALNVCNDQLFCSTIGNQIRRIYNDKAKMYAVGFHPENLLWASGTHVPEPVIWFDAANGNMRAENVSVDSVNHKWIAEFNSLRFADIYLNRTWAPSHDISTYHVSRFFPDERPNKFYYPMRQPLGSSLPRYGRLVGSPFGNTLIRDFATSLLLNENMGKDDIPDMLTLEFSLSPSVCPKQQPIDAESEDLLLQLDECVASLLKAIDQHIGMHNTLVVFTAAQSIFDLQATQSSHWKPRGVVSMRKATAILNLYLMAKHGQAQWVRNYAPGAIYLDREVAKSHNVSWDSLLNESAEFLHEVKGIERAIVAKNLDLMDSDLPIVQMMRRNYHPKRSGDIVLYLQPGWADEMDDGRHIQQQWVEEPVPLAFYGWRIPHALIYESHSMKDVAPTVTRLIGVANPDGCSGEAINLLK